MGYAFALVLGDGLLFQSTACLFVLCFDFSVFNE
jgi:hypothetical protein